MPALATAARDARAITDAALLDSLQASGFRYFWYQANPANGLIRDRSTSGSACSIAAVGFGLSAICVGVDHGWITRAQGRDRVLTTLQTFWTGPQGTAATGTIGYKGFFYHFLDMNTATRSASDVELSTIDTALLFAGILDAQQYFGAADSSETQIRALADSITWRADWNFMRNFNPGVLMGWKPGTQFGGFGQWIGYDEAMILYLLALGSPTHGVPTSAWGQWTSGYVVQDLYGQTFITCPPLFTHQYSHCWVDFRRIMDAKTLGYGWTYFQNSQYATLAQRAYCIANPGAFPGYSDQLWGLTASDDPYVGYTAHGAPPAQNDNGTITPTAAISSIPFEPETCLVVARTLWNTYKAQLWGPYGFRDAFNLRPPAWYDTDVLGIDQGPIVLMIENYLNGRVWSRIQQSAQLQTGLARAGFGNALAVPPPARGARVALSAAPAPAHATVTLRWSLARPAYVSVALLDVQGRLVRTLSEGPQTAGAHTLEAPLTSVRPGVYLVRLTLPGATTTRRIVHVD